jgi:DNA-binding response OmpR family regulator
VGYRGRRLDEKVFEAYDGVEALEKAFEVKPDLILLDIMMPRLDGKETRKRLKADPRTADTPVIHLSAVGDFESQLEGMEDGLTDYFTKPFAPRELADHVEDFLDPVKREAAKRLAVQKTGKLRLFTEIMHRERND